MRGLLIVAALGLAGSAWGQGAGFPDHQARARDTAQRMTTLVRAMACAPTGTVNTRELATVMVVMRNQFDADVGDEEFWRGWIRGAMDGAMTMADMPGPAQGSPECRALLLTAARIVEETHARHRGESAATGR